MSDVLELNVGAMSNAADSMRQKVDRLESALLDKKQVDCPVRHHFSPGLYARQITIPAGTVVVGAIHKTDNVVILSKGSLLVVQGDEVVRITAPKAMICKARSKNAVYALEESVWTNFFETTETDTAKLVELLTYSKESELLGGSSNKQILANAALEIGD